MGNAGDVLRNAGVNAGPVQKKCEDCGKMFVPKEARHRKCKDCFQNQGHDRGRTRGPEARPPDFPPGYPDYFDGQGVLKCEYVTTEAENIASRLGHEKMTMNQLRAFYEHVKLREDALNNSRPFREVRKDICSLKAIARERAEKRRIPHYFESFISRNVDRVTANADNKDAFEKAFLGGFVEHFQAVVAYCAGKLSKER